MRRPKRDAVRTARIERPAMVPWLVLGLALLAVTAAQAQTTQAQTTQAPGGGNTSAPTDGRTTPPVIAPPSSDLPSQQGKTGVIVPPPTTDPGMPIARPSPDAFPTPTVRPPGSPGGDPRIVPK